MPGFRRYSTPAIAAACFLIAMFGAAEAAGAFAVGVCGAYGYGFDFHKVSEARAAAMKKCTGGTCKLVGEMRKGLRGDRDRRQEPVRQFWLGYRVPSRQGGKHLDAPLFRIWRPRMRGARLGLRREGLTSVRGAELR